MGFFDSLGRMLGGDRDFVGASDDTTDRAASRRVRLIESWGISDTSHPEFPDGRAPAADPDEMAAPPRTTDYDRTHWERKLRTVLDGLPESEPQFDEMLREAGALGLEDDWVRRRQREEFTMMIRRAVADRRISPQEHRKIDLARGLIGLSDDEAESVLHEVIAEAEAIFGQEVEGKE